MLCGTFFTIFFIINRRRDKFKRYFNNLSNNNIPLTLRHFTEVHGRKKTYIQSCPGQSAFHMVSAFDVLPKVLENLVKTSWSYQTNDLQCARDVLRNRSISLAGFLFHSDDGRCTRLLWGQSQGTKVDGHDRIFLINDGRSCRDGFQVHLFGHWFYYIYVGKPEGCIAFWRSMKGT